MSFFKKMYWCLFVWRLPFAKDEELKDVDAIVTQAVSKLDDGTSGPGDELLADAIERIYRLYPSKPIIAQDVVAEVLERRGIPCVAIRKPEKGSYSHSSFGWNTHSITQEQFAICTSRGLRRIAIVAMPDHIVRSFLVYHNVGFEDVRVVAVDPTQIHYHHHKSLYWAMRGGRCRFLLREMECRLLFLITGRI